MISSQSQNPYVYCMNNPLRFIDPTGMMTVEHIEVNGHDVTLIDGHPAEYWSGSGSHGESMFDRVAQEHYGRVARGEYASGDYYTHGDFGTDSWGVNMVYHTDNTLGNLLGHNFGNDFEESPINSRLCVYSDGCTPYTEFKLNWWNRGGGNVVVGASAIIGGSAIIVASLFEPQILPYTGPAGGSIIMYGVAKARNGYRELRGIDGRVKTSQFPDIIDTADFNGTYPFFAIETR